MEHDCPNTLAGTTYFVYLWQPVILWYAALGGKKKGKEDRERREGGGDKMCGCKEICLECRVRECMTENRRVKHCPVPRLARTQKNMSLGDRDPDSGTR